MRDYSEPIHISDFVNLTAHEFNVFLRSGYDKVQEASKHSMAPELNTYESFVFAICGANALANEDTEFVQMAQSSGARDSKDFVIRLMTNIRGDIEEMTDEEEAYDIKQASRIMLGDLLITTITRFERLSEEQLPLLQFKKPTIN